MKRIHLLFPALLLTSASAMAQEHFSYTWIEADFVNMEIDGYDNDGSFSSEFNDGNGWGLSASYSFAPNWFVFSNFSSVQSDVDFVDNTGQRFSSDTDIDRFDLGVGYYIRMNDRSDWVFSLAYTDIDVDDFDFGGSSNSSFNDLRDDESDGFFADAGIRAQLLDRLEGSVGLRYTSIEEVDNFSLIGNALFEFTPMVGFNLGADIGDDLTTWVAGVRVNF